MSLDTDITTRGHRDPSGIPQGALVNADNRAEVYSLSGGKTVAFNKTASAVIKATAGRVCRVSVLVAGSAVGGIYDCATTGAAVAGNLLAVIPNVVGVYDLNLPCVTGIVYILGTGQTVAVSYI
ncbi:MAG: hypothetical protein RIR39_1973 [Pseudomonadota bacterium]|jgi:hypothetical protein